VTRLRAGSLRFVALAALLLGLVASGPEALAHEIGLSRGEYTLSGATLSAQITFARREIIGLVAGLDADHDSALTTAEIERSLDAIEGAVVGRIKVRGDGVTCRGVLEAATLAEEDGFNFRAQYRCPTPPREANVELTLLEDLPFGHRHLACVRSRSAPFDAILSQRNRSLSISAGPPEEDPAVPLPKGGDEVSFFRLGVEHILKGYDHLVFLLGLVLVGGRVRALLWVVTAFTIGHSITLGTAVLGVWAPSPRIVEPAIALSVVYVGIENCFITDAEKRWRVTIPFGLVHGFGFAAALQEMAMPRREIPAALALFNLGVEAGQLAVLSLLLPLVLYARRNAAFRDRGVKIVSAAIMMLGLVWFGSRA
jgi:hydrogenase/urease accessory protein HupE